MADTRLLRAAYAPWLRLAGALDDRVGWRPTRLPGWVVRDLVHHLTGDAQRGLVALFTPADRPADTDEVSYWRSWQPGSDGALAGLRATRIMASTWSSTRGPANGYAETARAVLVAADRADATAVVCSQGHALTVGALAHTLAVEATVHLLDLGDASTEVPAAECLAEARRVVESLLAARFPTDWADDHCVLLGTGRLEPTDAETATLGELADRLPAFG